MSPERLEIAFSADASSIKFGAGVTEEVGVGMRRLGARRVMVVTDLGLSDGDSVATTLASLRGEGVDLRKLFLDSMTPLVTEAVAGGVNGPRSPVAP